LDGILDGPAPLMHNTVMWRVLTILNRWASIALCYCFGFVVVCAVLALFARGTYEDVWGRIFLYTFVFSMPVCLAQISKQCKAALTITRAALGILFCTILAILRATDQFWLCNIGNRISMFVLVAAFMSIILNECAD